MTTTETLCVLEHDKPRAAAQPLAVCAWHADRVTQAVAETPAHYAALARQLAPTGSSGGQPTSGTRDIGIRIDHRVATLRTDLRNTTSTWARIAVEERSMTPPQDTITAVCAWIVGQIDWYLAQAWTRQFACDMIENQQQARRLIDPNRVRIFPVAPCPEPVCPGTLYARLRTKDDLLPPDVTCTDSPEDDDGTLLHYWPADRWLTLGRRLHRQEPA